MIPAGPATRAGNRRPPRRRARVSGFPVVFSGVHFRFRPGLEFMEDRTLLSTFLVNTTADSGAGSLRQAILDSNAATSGASIIDFAIPGQGVQTIAPISPLPAITNSVLIDGFSQPGYHGTPLIELSGQAGTGDGLTIRGSGSTIRGLQIIGFFQGAGILISGTSATKNTIEANDIGTDPAGVQSLANNFGVQILSGASNNLVGGATSAAGNLIAFNTGPGVDVEGDTSVGNQITANRIFANDDQGALLPTGVGSPGEAIDLGGDGITYNASSPREGPNNFQNFPIIATTSDGGLEGWLGGSTPNTLFQIDVFASAAYGPGGSGQAEDYLGSLEATTDSQGEAVFAVPFSPPEGLPVVTATATDPLGNTSEVSAQRRASLEAPTEIGLAAAGQPVIFSASLGDGIALEDPDAGPIDAAWDMTLSVAAGTLTLSSQSGLVGSGNGTGTLEYQGPLSALNAALEDMSFTPAGGTNGDFTAVSLTAVSEGAPFLVQVISTYGIFSVTTTADSGPGSLRQAILDSNAATSGTNTIDFAIPGKGVQTIAPISPLPAITNAVLIDGFSQPGYAGTPLIELSGSQAGGGDGLTITGAGVTVRGLDIDNFSQGAGIHITGAGATNNWVYGVFAGTDPTGTLSEPNYSGVAIDGGASNNLVGTNGDGVADAAERNVLSGNLFEGVSIDGVGTNGNVVAGNFIGTDISGSVALGNAENGVQIGNGASANTIGGTIPAAGNEISANTGYGVRITGAGTEYNLVQGNFIGTDSTGTVALGNTQGGGEVDNGAANNTMGGLTTADGIFDGFDFTSATSPLNLTLRGDLSGPPQQQSSGGATTVYHIDVESDGGLLAIVQAQGFTAQLEMLDSQGRVIVQSDGLSLRDPEAVIDQYVSAGNYSLVVESTGGAGTYVLTTTLTPSSAPFQPIHVEAPTAIVAGDFNGDGRTDLAVADEDGLSVLLGNGDGTFGPQTTYAVGSSPSAIVAGDFNGDGRTDLAVANAADGTVSVLLGNGDGTFQTPIIDAVGSRPSAIVTGDFNGDGRTDLAVINNPGIGIPGSSVSVLLGNGDGTFRPQVTYAVGDNPTAIVAPDFTGDGRLDLAVVNEGSFDFNGKPIPGTSSVSVLLGNGDGTFQPQVTYAVGGQPLAIVTADFNDDGRTDLAVANAADETVSVLLGNGDGTFQPQVTYGVGYFSDAIVAADFNDDGRTDLAVANAGAASVSVLLGNGDGTFQPQVTYAVGDDPVAMVKGDFNGVGRTDLAVANGSELSTPNTVSVLLGNGDGTFQGGLTDHAGVEPLGIASGDFNGDGRTDLAVTNIGDGTVSVLLGNGDGTFQPQVVYAVGSNPRSVVAGDFNGDGRLDLAVANANSNTVSVLLGNGDGTFQPQVTYAVGGDPSPILAGDFNGDGRTDLAVANLSSGTVSVLLGNGDGTFQPQVISAAGSNPDSIVAGDFNGDGKLDLAVANEYSDDVSVLLGNGDGTFQAAQRYAAGTDALSIVAGDFNGDGKLDLAVANDYPNDVSVLLGNGDGTFQAAQEYAAGNDPYSIVAGDFNADGKLDLAVANDFSDTVSVLLGNGDGTFQPQVIYAVGLNPVAIVAGDFTADGKLDLATSNTGSRDVSVLLATGDGMFVGHNQFATTPYSTPLVADINGDGTDDVLVVDGDGNILYRQGVPGQPGTFEPPVTVNVPLPDGMNPYTSRDIAWVPNSPAGPILASVDAQDANVSLYAYRNGAFARVGSLTTGQLPAQIIAADLNGTGWDDLVVRNAGDGTLSIYSSAGDKTVSGLAFTGPKNTGNQLFGFPVTLSVGIGVSDVQAVDTTGDGRLDLVVTNKLTGQVSVLLNLGGGKFAVPVPYRAGTGLSAVVPGSTPEVNSLEATAGVDAGSFTTGGPTDLVTINPGSNTLDVLAGLGEGHFANPATLDTASPAHVVRVADFNHDGIPDLALLTANGVSIYMSNGNGGFLPSTTYEVPSESDGLTVADVNHDGNPDLLVGDAFGDVLVLLGNSNGTFQPYHEANQSVELAVADLTGNGSKDIIYADQSLDRVVVDYGIGNSTVLANHSTGLLDPGAIKLADMNGDGVPDLIVANSGSNNVLIFPGLGNGQFGPAVNGGNGYFAGTNPVGISVADLTGSVWPNGEPRLDLVVADEGSNDVAILLNKGNFSFTHGPRLSSGGIGPVSTVAGYFTGGTSQDLLVTNSGSNNVTLLQGVGGGFFKPATASPFSVGIDPVQSFVGNFDGKTDLVTVNAGSNDLTLVSDFNGPNPVTTTISSGGLDPETAFAFESGSGFEDLVVGNTGDGVLALLARE
jgi:hypothetical protein